MGSRRLGGGDPNFASGEAEELVCELRDHLRMEQQARENVKADVAARSRARATSIIGELASRLERRFERYAWAAFDETPELIDDAVAEMFAEFCRRAMDTSETNVLLERRFNLVVKALIIDAVRKVRVQHGLTKHGDPATHGHTLLSLEEANEQAAAVADGERTARPLEVADPTGEDAHGRILEQLVGAQAQAWVAQLPPRQRAVVTDRLLEGKSWAEVAARSGVSAKTAQADLGQALARLRALYEGPERSEQ